MKKFLIPIVAILVVVIVSVVFLMLRKPAVSENGNNSSNCTTIEGSEVTVVYESSQSFSPKCIKVKSGTKFTWKNASGKVLEVGADPHPVHTGNKEVSDGEFSLTVPNGEERAVTLNKTGTFGYHNHQHSSASGTIIVE